jgi:pantetheine-phosphate adenylyltransferase
MNESPESLATWLRPRLPLDDLSNPEECLSDLSRRWCERHRYWHDSEHLKAMVSALVEEATGESRNILLLAALYHDAIYDPTLDNNEQSSAQLLLKHARNPADARVQASAELILTSRWDHSPKNDLARRFFELDTCQFLEDQPLGTRLRYELAIFKEYQWAPWPEYAEKRAEFLHRWADRFPTQARGVAECLSILGSMQPRIAIYPGSFNPFHAGHLSILRQAETVFDKVIVAVGINRQKPGAAEAIHQRTSQLNAQLRFHQVTSYGGLLSDFLDQLGYPATVVRGVRDGTDLEAELRFSRFLGEYRPKTQVVWIGCQAEYQHVSSSGIQELESFRAGAGSRYIPSPKDIYGLS